MTVLSSAYSSSHRAQVAEYRRFGYLANGWNKVRRWGGRTTTLETAGIVGPSRVTDSWQPAPTTASGDSTPGFHLFRYRYMDSRSGYVSNPSEERELEVASGSQELTFPIDTSGAANIIRSTDTKVDRIVIEMSVAGGDSFFKAAEVANSASSVVVDVTDAFLETQFLDWDDYGHDAPPLAKNIVSHRERLWLFGQVLHAVGSCSPTNASPNVAEGSEDPDWIEEALGSSTVPTVGWFLQVDGDTVAYEISYYEPGSNRIVLKTNYLGTTASNVSYKIFNRVTAIWVSSPAYPESFQALKFLNSPNGEAAGDVTAGVGYGSNMIFFTLNSTFKFTWDQDPLVDGFWAPLSSKSGALNQRVVIEAEGRVYSMDRRGWYAWDGVFPKLISRPIEPLREEINYDQSENFHCCYFPESRCIRWFVCFGTDTYPKNYVQLDIDTGAWSTGSYLQGISDSRLVPTADGLRVLYGDENGHTWFADVGVCDGCPADYSHLTVSGVATTTVIPVSALIQLPIANEGLKGAYLTRRTSAGLPESRPILSNTVTEITLGSAFTAAPADGDVLWVGGIPSKLRTKAFRGRAVGSMKRSQYLNVLFVPTEAVRYLQLRMYADNSGTPKTWNDPDPNVTDPVDGAVWPGENTSYPASDWLLDLSEADGVITIPIGSEWRRCFDLEFEILEPDADFRLLVIEHSGQSQKQRTP